MKGVIFSHTCDSMKALSDIWTLEKRHPLHFNLMIPTRLDSNLTFFYFKAEIERLISFLESHFGKIPPKRLSTSIEMFNSIRKHLKDIYEWRQKFPRSISDKAFAQIIRAGYIMDRKRYLELIKNLKEEIGEKKVENKNLIPLFLTENMVHSPSYFSLFEDAGAYVVKDDLCSGYRFLKLMIPDHIDPFEALIRGYLDNYLCPTKYKGPQAHIEGLLLWEIKKFGAGGVIFLFYKYCESHYFDYPDLKYALESKGIPTLLLEIEDTSSMGQLKVRIQAFIEILRPF